VLRRWNLKLQFDFYHRQILHGDVTTALRRLMPLIGHIQIASMPSRSEPDGFISENFAVPATFAAVLLTVTLIACLRPGTAAYAFFASRKVVWIGLISYSLYLWHWGGACYKSLNHRHSLVVRSYPIRAYVTAGSRVLPIP
jgi:peptidoglycan/LPS O-acetylase OafA/YrhL